jgi:hypothetical protein
MTVESTDKAQEAITMLSNFTISDFLMICAVILAPLIAVQVDKYLEKKRNKKERKLNVFKILMATRGRALDPRHVEALNMIDLEFDGEKPVTDAWKAYLDHLVNMPKYPTSEGKNEEEKKSEKTIYDSQMATWGDQRVNYLADLLFTMGNSLDYNFDKTHIKRSIYSPQGHADIENEQQLLRRASIELLLGRLTLPVKTVTNPLSEDELKARKEEQAEQKLLRELLIKHYKGEIPSTVKIIEDHKVPEHKPE